MEKKTQKTPLEKYEIPIPKRGDVFKVFKKAATHQDSEKTEKKSDSPRRPKK